MSVLRRAGVECGHASRLPKTKNSLPSADTASPGNRQLALSNRSGFLVYSGTEEIRVPCSYDPSYSVQRPAGEKRLCGKRSQTAP